MIRRALPSSTIKAIWSCAAPPANYPSSRKPSAFRRLTAYTAWVTRDGPPTGAPRKKMPTRIATAPAKIVVVHNGIVENYLELKHELASEGHKFVTETDTEIIAHLVEKYMDGGPLENAVRKAIKRLSGVYALAILSTKDPQEDRRRAFGTARCHRLRKGRILRCQRHPRASQPTPATCSFFPMATLPS